MRAVCVFRHGQDGCFLLTLMNSLAAEAAGIDEEPITVSEAITACRAAVERFKRAEGDAYRAFLVEHSKIKWNLARVATMHMCRLAHTLEALFSPTAALYAPKVPESSVKCEWTLGAFIQPPEVCSYHCTAEQKSINFELTDRRMERRLRSV